MSRRPNPSRALVCAVVGAALFLAGCGTVKRYAYEGFDRERFHVEMNAEVLAFLNRTMHYML